MKTKTEPLYGTSEQWGVVWNDGAPPEEFSDGRLLLVVLKMTKEYTTLGSGLEYYGRPVVVCCYGHKMKTTVNPVRVDPDDVERWSPFPPNLK